MKFYRVAYYVNGGNSAGFSWHTSRRAAVRAAREDFAKDPAEYNHVAGDIDDRIDTITVPPTRAGILHVLNTCAGHPDNG